MQERPYSQLPEDSTLLRLRAGSLLVSVSHATFCGLTFSEVQELAEGGTGRPRTSEATPEQLLAKLDEHGFFGPPRPSPEPERAVQLQLTNACNLRCRYCCTSSGKAREGELLAEQWRELIDAAVVEMGAVRIGFLGGEPLLVPGALDLVEYALGRTPQVVLYTNGIYLADEGAGLGNGLTRRVAQLMSQGLHLKVSLASADRARCDDRSGGPRFDAVLRGLQRLAAFGALPELDVMLCPEDVDSFPQDLDKLRRALPSGVRLAVGLAFTGGREDGRSIFPSPERLERALDYIAFEAGETIAGPKRAPVTLRRDACGCALGESLHVRSDGMLFPCFRMVEAVGRLRVGQVREGFRDTYRRLQAYPLPASAQTVCAECPLRSLCGGGCRTDNALFTGDPSRPLCGPWRVRVLSELLAENRVGALEWSTPHLAAEARRRGIVAPEVRPVLSPREQLLTLRSPQASPNGSLGAAARAAALLSEVNPSARPES